MTVGVQLASIKYYGKICTLMQIFLNAEKAPQKSKHFQCPFYAKLI